MTRAKPNSDRRRVIVDLSLPPGASVNAGIDKTSYLDSVFSLTFSTVDHITGQLNHLGRGLFVYLGFYIAFNTVQVISRRVVGRAEETSTYSLLGFCTVNCRPTASNYQLSHLQP